MSHRFESECAGKERHVSRAAAEAVAAMGRAALEPYLCTFCHEWHLASIPGHRARSTDIGRGPAFEKLRHHANPRRRHPTARRAR